MVSFDVTRAMLNGTEPQYSTELGQAFVGDSLALMREIPDESVNLVLTSPPFALTRQKAYGNTDEDEYVAWFLPFAYEIKRILTHDGSLVIDLGGSYLKGAPVRSLYQYELLISLCRNVGFHLAQEFFHYNPSRLPTPAEWVTVRRIRVKDSVNVVWWLSKSTNPKSDNKRVLQPYSRAMEDLLSRGAYNAGKRPSEHDINARSFLKNHGGAIPPNLLSIANTESNSLYIRRSKEAGAKLHPARFPAEFAEFFIKFLTEERDLVFDPFAGSNATGAAAEKLNRRWLAIEINEEYVSGSHFRFEETDQLLLLRDKKDDNAS